MSVHSTTQDENQRTTGTAKSAEALSRRKENWRLCEQYKKAARENMLNDGHPVVWLQKRYDVSDSTIRSWMKGNKPKAWKAYLLSKEKNIENMTRQQLGDKYDLTYSGVCGILRQIKRSSKRTDPKLTYKQQLIDSGLLGKVEDARLASMVGCNKNTVTCVRCFLMIPPMDVDEFVPSPQQPRKFRTTPTEINWRSQLMDGWL